jgi:hypothetical protein
MHPETDSDIHGRSSLFDPVPAGGLFFAIYNTVETKDQSMRIPRFA